MNSEYLSEHPRSSVELAVEGMFPDAVCFYDADGYLVVHTGVLNSGTNPNNLIGVMSIEEDTP